MLAHERAHLRRRDPLIRPLLALFYSFFLMPWASLLLQDWSRAAERECDAEAGRQVGSRAEVAGALVRSARLMQRHAVSEPLHSSFTGEMEDIQGRVSVLLQPDQTTHSGQHSLVSRLLLAGVSLGPLVPISFWLRHAVDFFVHH
jgi:beta-lactamase regulating signal transducer with metallopeptidase domain